MVRPLGLLPMKFDIFGDLIEMKFDKFGDLIGPRLLVNRTRST